MVQRRAMNDQEGLRQHLLSEGKRRITKMKKEKKNKQTIMMMMIALNIAQTLMTAPVSKLMRWLQNSGAQERWPVAPRSL